LDAVVAVSITEEDLRKLGRWPIDDQRLARLIRTVASGGAVAIGLDIFRDLPQPPGSDSLRAAMNETDQLIGIELWPTDLGTPPPPALQGTDRIAVANLVRDPDGVVRRAVIGLMPAEGPTRPSLSLAVASRALGRRAVTAGGDQLEEWVPPGMTPTDGGYWWAEPTLRFEGADGSAYEASTRQIVIDFRPAAEGPAFVAYSATDVLEGAVDPSVFAGKVVIIGSGARSVRDTAPTPVGILDGYEIQAIVTGQLVAIVRGEATSLRSWSDMGEVGWILFWCVLGVGLATGIRSAPLLGGAAIAGLGGTFAIAWASSGRACGYPWRRLLWGGSRRPALPWPCFELASGVLERC